MPPNRIWTLTLTLTLRLIISSGPSRVSSIPLPHSRLFCRPPLSAMLPGGTPSDPATSPLGQQAEHLHCGGYPELGGGVRDRESSVSDGWQWVCNVQVPPPPPPPMGVGGEGGRGRE